MLTDESWFQLHVFSYMYHAVTAVYALIDTGVNFMRNAVS